MARLMRKYKEEIIPSLKEKFAYKSVMSVPKIEKITINIGVGEAKDSKDKLHAALSDLEKISGQKPLVTKAKKSVAGFKIREGWPIGCKVTLRNKKMYEFLDRLVSVALPRIRDFRGLNPKSFDKSGNYNFGLREQIVFPEIRYEAIDQLRGMDICITISASNLKESFALLKAFDFPLKNNE